MTCGIDQLKRLDSKIEHLKCIFLGRPSRENIHLLRNELRNPKFSEYYLIFSNKVEHDYLKHLAQSDELQMVKEVREIYLDFYSLFPKCFTLNIPASLKLIQYSKRFTDTLNGLMSVLLASEIYPNEILHLNNSIASLNVKKEIANKLRNSDLKSSDKNGKSVLMILDRKEDPVTPLLIQWNYISMLHEYFAIKNNLLSVDREKYTLDIDFDEFFRENYSSNYGVLSESINKLVSKFKSIPKGMDIETFASKYPEYKKMSGSLNKHINIMSKVTNIIQENHLLEISETQQNLLFSPQMEISEEKLMSNVGLLLVHALANESLCRTQRNALVDKILRYAGSAERNPNLKLFKGKSKMRFFQNKEDNVYTQHTPLIIDILNDYVSGKAQYFNKMILNASEQRVSRIILFVIGGITYEEVLAVQELNIASKSNVEVILGGSTVLNSKSFISDFSKLQQSFG